MFLDDKTLFIVCAHNEKLEKTRRLCDAAGTVIRVIRRACSALAHTRALDPKT